MHDGSPKRNIDRVLISDFQAISSFARPRYRYTTIQKARNWPPVFDPSLCLNCNGRWRHPQHHSPRPRLSRHAVHGCQASTCIILVQAPAMCSRLTSFRAKPRRHFFLSLLCRSRIPLLCRSSSTSRLKVRQTILSGYQQTNKSRNDML